MAPSKIAKARSFMVFKPVVRSAAADRKLAASLRRLGVDQRTVSKLTGQDGTHSIAAESR